MADDAPRPAPPPVDATLVHAGEALAAAKDLSIPTDGAQAELG